MKTYKNTQKGYSLVEVLVAITVLLVALVGPLTVAQVGLKRAINSREQTMAVFLAQEGIEAVFKIREDSALLAYPEAFSDLNLTWGGLVTLNNRCTEGSPCGVLINTDGDIGPESFYTCDTSNCKLHFFDGTNVPYRQGAASGVDTQFERRLVVVADNTKAIVRSTVTWGTRSDQTVTLETYVYNIYYEAP